MRAGVGAGLPGRGRARHRHNREDVGLQALLQRMSVYAIWDDHEVRNDFAGSVEPLMPIGRQAFLEYFPSVTGSDDPHRMYRAVRWGQLLEIFILDRALHELQYEINNRPLCVHIPLHGLLRVLGGESVE